MPHPQTRILAAALWIVPLGSAGAPDEARERFFREVLDARAVERTSEVDLSDEAGYRPDKLDLVRGLPDAAGRLGLDLQALLMVGPNGPDAAYSIAVVLAERDAFRLSGLSLHAGRIVAKGTTPLGRASFARFLRDLRRSELVVPFAGDLEALESRLSSAAAGERVESSFDFMLVVWLPEGALLHFANLRTAERDPVEALMARVNLRLRALTTTYPPP